MVGIPKVIPTWFWAWAAWRLGRAPYQGHANDPARRPPAAPAKIPAWAWLKLWIMQGRPGTKPKVPIPPAIDPALDKARAMLKFARTFAGPYVYGGEHDGTLADDDPVHGHFDCSSSTSLLLWKFSLLAGNVAQVSTFFESWGLPGRGKYVTVHANGDHVWIEFDLPEGYFRFDTSPHGDGENGPRVRTLRRSDAGFIHRHPAGL